MKTLNFAGSALFGLAALTFTGCTSTANNGHAGHTGGPATNAAAIDHSKMDHGSMDHSGMKSSPNAAAADFDLQFIDTMIVHHQAAVDMATMIAGKAERPELKKLGARMAMMQQKEIEEMKAWRDKWFAGAQPAINMEMAGMADSMRDMDMKKLGAATGSEFELEFIKQMVPHHEGAIAMAKEAQQRSKKDEIRTMADAVIREQQAEIDMMRTWKTEWSK